MKFLIDTNILIPLEPTSLDDVSPAITDAASFVQIVQAAGHHIVTHPDQLYDINRDKDKSRRELRQKLFKKYTCLPSSPSTSEDLTAELGDPPKHSNDWVDNQLLIALHIGAVANIVTEDKDLQSKARRLGHQDKVLYLAEALNFAQTMFGKPDPPPKVESIPVYDLNQQDPIFNSLRADYKNFNEWLKICIDDDRDAWVIKGSNNRYAALCIINEETKDNLKVSGKILKICTFKVSSEYSGYHYSELLLKTIFHIAMRKKYDWLYITVFPKYEPLIGILMDFGFQIQSRKSSRGEYVLLKPLRYSPEELEKLAPKDFLELYGPYTFKLKGITPFMVPIKPNFHRILFPGSDPDLFPGIHPFGNCIRKVYICRASIRRLNAGDVLFFYISKGGEIHGIYELGVVEDTMVSDDPESIAQFAGKRSIYSYNEIRELTQKRALAIKFWHSGTFSEPIALNELIIADLHPPRSIQEIRQEKRKWLYEEMKRRLPSWQFTQGLPI